MRKSTLALFGAITILAAGCNSVNSPSAELDLLEVRVCPLPAAVADCDKLADNPAACVAQPINLPAGTSRTFCALGRYESLVSPDDNLFVPEQWRNVSSQTVWSFSPNADGVLTVTEDGVVSNVGDGTTGTFEITGTADGRVSEPSVISATAPELQGLDINIKGIQSTSRLVGQTDQFICYGLYSAPFCNGQPDNTRCPITSVNWTPPTGANSPYTVSASGLGTALSASNGYVDVWCSKTDPTNGLLESPTASLYVCDPEVPGTVQSVTIVNVPTGAITIGAAPYQLAAQVTFVDCNPDFAGQTRTITMTDGVVWESGDEAILTVDQSGRVSGVGIGSSTVTATLGGVVSTVDLSVIADAANPICELTAFTSEGSGDPAVPPAPARTSLLPGLQTSVTYQSTLVCLDGTTGEALAPEATINSVLDENATWSVAPKDTVSATGLVVEEPTAGVVTIQASADVPEVWTVTLTYVRPQNQATYTQTLDVTLLKATLTSIRNEPELVCVGGALTTGDLPGLGGLLGADNVEVRYFALYTVENSAGGTPGTCEANISDVATSDVLPNDVTSDLVGIILPPLGDLTSVLLKSCADGPIAVPDISQGQAPVLVSNVDPNDGLVEITGNHEISPDPSGTIAAGACVYSSLAGSAQRGETAVLVATELQAVCDLLQGGLPSPGAGPTQPVDCANYSE